MLVIQACIPDCSAFRGSNWKFRWEFYTIYSHIFLYTRLGGALYELCNFDLLNILNNWRESIFFLKIVFESITSYFNNTYYTVRSFHYKLSNSTIE